VTPSPLKPAAIRRLNGGSDDLRFHKVRARASRRLPPDAVSSSL